jgi:hypothetical protein
MSPAHAYRRQENRHRMVAARAAWSWRRLQHGHSHDVCQLRRRWAVGIRARNRVRWRCARGTGAASIAGLARLYWLWEGSWCWPKTIAARHSKRWRDSRSWVADSWACSRGLRIEAGRGVVLRLWPMQCAAAARTGIHQVRCHGCKWACMGPGKGELHHCSMQHRSLTHSAKKLKHCQTISLMHTAGGLTNEREKH